MRSPTYDDVADQERTWDSQFVVEMYKKGYTFSQMREVLPAATPINSANNIIQHYRKALAEGRQYLGKARPERWNDSKPKPKAK